MEKLSLRRSRSVNWNILRHSSCFRVIDYVCSLWCKKLHVWTLLSAESHPHVLLELACEILVYKEGHRQTTSQQWNWFQCILHLSDQCIDSLSLVIVQHVCPYYICLTHRVVYCVITHPHPHTCSPWLLIIIRSAPFWRQSFLLSCQVLSVEEM